MNGYFQKLQINLFILFELEHELIKLFQLHLSFKFNFDDFKVEVNCMKFSLHIHYHFNH
jgi:hypothetical protein